MKELQKFFLVTVCITVFVLPTSIFAQVEFIPYGHTWKFFRGTTTPSSPDPTAWRLPIFDDSTWETGATSIGYGDDDDATVLGDMRGNYASVYLRTTFNVTNVESVTALLISASIDDGMIVYLNGDEIARFGLGDPLTEVTFEDFAAGHESGFVELIDASINVLSLLEGENVIAVEVHNQSIASSDLTFDMRLSGNDPRIDCLTTFICETRNSGARVSWTGPVVYESIAVTKNGTPVAGSPFAGDTTEYFDPDPGDYDNEYVVTATLPGGGACDAAVCSTDIQGAELIETGDEWRFFRGTQAPSIPTTDWRTSGFDDSLWETGPTGIGYGDTDDATVLEDMMGSYRTVYLRKTFNLPDPTLLTNMVLYMDYDDGYIAYLDGTEVARSASMGVFGQEFAFDDSADFDHEAGPDDVTDVSSQLGALSAGPHVLAIEVHNTSIDSSDLSAIPQLDINECVTVFTCAYDDMTGDVTLTIEPITVDSITITRNGQPLPGSPFPSGTTQIIDSTPGVTDDLYEMTATVGGFECNPLQCTVTCGARDPDLLSCVLSLVNGSTQAELGWQTPPDTDSIGVFRETVLLATLSASESSYIDPDVEALEPEDDTDFSVEFNLTNGDTCTISCPSTSLCPENFTCEPSGNNVVLTWDNLVKEWESLTINRDGVPLATLPGDATTFTDDTETLIELVTVNYELVPLAPLGEEVTTCDQTCALTLDIPEDARFAMGSLTYLVEFGAGQDSYVANQGEVGNLDGSWVRDLTQDSWDGSAPLTSGAAPDGDAPGGIAVEVVAGQDPCLSDGSVLRVLDPGDPSAPGGALEDVFPNPYTTPNNRSFVLGLPTGVNDRNLLRDGVTFVARWRLHPNPTEFTSPTGDLDGDVLADGLGHVGFVFLNDGSLVGAGASASVSFAMPSALTADLQLSTTPTTTAPLAIDAFVSMWVIVQDPEGDGTYDITTHVNGRTTPITQLSVAGATLQTPMADFGSPVGNYLVLGAPSGGGDSDVQIDYLGYTPGIVTPTRANCGGGGTGFRRGDHDGSGVTDITDALNTLGFLFLSQTPPICLDATDADNSAAIDISDALNALTFLFLGLVQIPPPGPNDCGEDPTVVIPAGQVLGLPEQPASSLGCEQYPGAAFPGAACP